MADRNWARRSRTRASTVFQDDRAGAAQPCDAYRVGGGDIVDQDFRMAGRRQPRDIDDVLDADRDAMQRAARMAGSYLRLGGARCCHRGIGIEPNEHVELRVEPLDAVEQRPRQLDRREFAGRDRPRRFGSRKPVQLAHRAAPVRGLPAAATRGRVGEGATAYAHRWPWLGRGIGRRVDARANPLACAAAAATSSGNCASAFSSPARRASSSTVWLSMLRPSLVLTRSRRTSCRQIPGRPRPNRRRRIKQRGHE